MVKRRMRRRHVSNLPKRNFVIETTKISERNYGIFTENDERTNERTQRTVTTATTTIMQPTQSKLAHVPSSFVLFLLLLSSVLERNDTPALHTTTISFAR